MPPEFREYGRDWRRLNPGVTVHDWSWHDLPPGLANADVLDDLRSRCSHGGSVELTTALADVIDYDLIARYGGMYANCDLQPVRPLPAAILCPGGPWAASEDAGHLVNAAFGGPPGSPFWTSVVRGILPARYWRLRDAGEAEMNQLTGPHLLAEAQASLPGAGLTVYPPQVFSPLHWSAIPPGETADGRWSLETLPPETVAVHHWDHRRSGRSNVVS